MAQDPIIGTIRGSIEERNWMHSQAAEHGLSLHSWMRWRLGLEFSTATGSVLKQLRISEDPEDERILREYARCPIAPPTELQTRVEQIIERRRLTLQEALHQSYEQNGYVHNLPRGNGSSSDERNDQ